MISSNSNNDLPDSPKSRAIDALLAAHADALIRKPTVRQEDFDFLLDEYELTGREALDVSALMSLSHQINETLAPVAPSEEFMARLKNDLTGQAEVTLLLRWRRLPPLYRAAASLGGLTITAGILLIALRRVLDAVNFLHRRTPLKTTESIS